MSSEWRRNDFGVASESLPSLFSVGGDVVFLAFVVYIGFAMRSKVIAKLVNVNL